MLKLTNKTEGNVNVLKNIYPNISVKNNLVIIDKNSILRNNEFKEQYKTNKVRDFFGFEFKINKNGKIIESRFHKKYRGQNTVVPNISEYCVPTPVFWECAVLVATMKFLIERNQRV
ncbi:MAG: hypothetical protein OEY06_04180 [Gammaproteobacteria bacterium]|nr:hypothetical protein [Gammaproteobacteria bacterium]